jgi:hypothetical protein
MYVVYHRITPIISLYALINGAKKKRVPLQWSQINVNNLFDFDPTFQIQL